MPIKGVAPPSMKQRALVFRPETQGPGSQIKANLDHPPKPTANNLFRGFPRQKGTMPKNDLPLDQLPSRRTLWRVPHILQETFGSSVGLPAPQTFLAVARSEGKAPSGAFLAVCNAPKPRREQRISRLAKPPIAWV